MGDSVFGEVRALVVFPELAAAGGAAGVVVLFAFDGAALSLLPFDFCVRGLVVLPEFAAAVGFCVPASSEAFASFVFDALVDFDFLLVLLAPAFCSPAPSEPPAAAAVLSLFSAPGVDLLFLADLLLCSPAEDVFPEGGVALADGSATSLFLVLLVLVGSVWVASLLPSPLLAFDLVRDFFVPFVALVLFEAVAELSSLFEESVFLLREDFFVVDLLSEFA